MLSAFTGKVNYESKSHNHYVKVQWYHSALFSVNLKECSCVVMKEGGEQCVVTGEGLHFSCLPIFFPSKSVPGKKFCVFMIFKIYLSLEYTYNVAFIYQKQPENHSALYVFY